MSTVSNVFHALGVEAQASTSHTADTVCRQVVEKVVLFPNHCQEWHHFRFVYAMPGHQGLYGLNEGKIKTTQSMGI